MRTLEDEHGELSMETGKRDHPWMEDIQRGEQGQEVVGRVLMDNQMKY